MFLFSVYILLSIASMGIATNYSLELSTTLEGAKKPATFSDGKLYVASSTCTCIDKKLRFVIFWADLDDELFDRTDESKQDTPWVFMPADESEKVPSWTFKVKTENGPLFLLPGSTVELKSLNLVESSARKSKLPEFNIDTTRYRIKPYEKNDLLPCLYFEAVVQDESGHK